LRRRVFLLLLRWWRRQWWWWWLCRRHVRGLNSTWLYWGPVGHHNLRKLCYQKWRQRKWRDWKWCNRKWRQSRGRKWRHLPALFSYYCSSTQCPLGGDWN
jgi:hypothetical protein